MVLPQLRPTFLVLEPNIPVTIRVTRARLEDRETRDPVTGVVSLKQTLVLELSEVNSQTRVTSLSFLSRKAINSLQPYISSGEITRRRLEVTRRGQGYATEYEFRLL